MSTPFTMKPSEWIGALAEAWWLGHRDVCADCNCRPDANPYSLRVASSSSSCEHNVVRLAIPLPPFHEHWRAAYCDRCGLVISASVDPDLLHLLEVGE